jgi:hypothetical protein
MGVCCSVDLVDNDTLQRSYSPALTPELTPETPVGIEEKKTTEDGEAEEDTALPAEEAAPQHTANQEALKRARAARGSMAIVACSVPLSNAGGASSST